MKDSKKQYDLQKRTETYAVRVRDYCLRLPKNEANAEYVPQLIRAGSSPGANYIEANECLGGKDFNVKIRTCKRESKESAYWVQLTITNGAPELEDERKWLTNEAKELTLIFAAIMMTKNKKAPPRRQYTNFNPLNFEFGILLDLEPWFLGPLSVSDYHS